jgi:AraC family transcriptional regulator, transcriptional activator of the genes for pyochelin and ferripyochelin receptors
MGQALPVAGIAQSMRWIEVSPEMTALLGQGAGQGAPMPEDPVRLAFSFGGPGDPATVRISETAGTRDGANLQLVLVVARAALLRMGGREPIGQDVRGYHLPTELRAIALALRDCAMAEAPRNVYRLAKSLELFCETIRLQREAALVPLAEGGALSFADSRRLLDARRMIDERWQEKLTLETIARACGLNRAKLTRGFREMFACTIAEALAERRLRQASRMLLTTDLPVSSIGYENGYLNNASFARAFGRRFGLTPSDYRACGVAA